MWTFHTIYHPKIWGGRLIADLKGIEPPYEAVGESWELSALPGMVSVVKSEADKGMTLDSLVGRMGARLLGKINHEKYGERFPLLIKFIDAASDLSVQVHPDDRMAAEEGLTNGKTELWYIVSTRPGARIANGFQHPIEPESYNTLLESGEIEDTLRYIQTDAGMTFFIPAGRVHAIGGGNLICEIQQTSDTTYRLYDYQRRDAQGCLRELHTEKAFRALDFSDCGGDRLQPEVINDVEKLIVDDSKFSVRMIETKSRLSRDYSDLDSFVVLIAIKGDVTLLQHDSSDDTGIKTLVLREGEAALVAAVTEEITIEPSGDSILLETYIR